MQRLANFDVSRQFASRGGQVLAQLVFGALCATAMIGLRSTFNIWAPTSGPFALIYPTVLLATLYGHWRAGVAAFVLAFLWAWYFVLPSPSSFTFADPTDPARVALNGASCLIVIVFAEAFRRAARLTMDQIRRSADRRLVLLADLEHRTKNNFALVASMLEMQKRGIADATLHAPLDDAVGRVRTFAETYSNLADDQSEASDVEVKPYLDILLDRLESAAVPDNLRIYREIDALTIPREEAVAIGLYLNEALSNALKYAFPDARPGTIGVFFHVRGEAWRLVIEDHGVGLGHAGDASTGLGSKLMIAFARQAGAEHRASPIANGYRAEMARGASDNATGLFPSEGLARR